MNSSTTRAVWLEVDSANKETTIADAINRWCSSNPDIQIESIEIHQEHMTKYKALIIYTV